jgi:RNA polymerase sigma-70 factor (ECF subfamily)
MIQADVVPEATAPTVEQLAEVYAGRVLRFAAMVCSDQTDSEDLAQEALIKAMRALPRLRVRDPSAVEAWLWHIVVNAARDAARGASRRRALWERLVARRDPVIAEDVEQRALRHIGDAELLAEVRHLSARDRTLVALRFGADLSYDQIGLVLSQRPDAVRQATRRALRRLHDRIEETQ